MIQDAIKFAKACQACQTHGDFIHQPPQLLHSSILSWPFHAWGLVVIGSFKPSYSRGHVFILTATYYFSKWAKAIPLREVGAKQVANFIRTYLIYRYGVPYKIISDNALYFKNQMMIRIVEKYKFRHSFSSSYNSS